MSKNIVDLTLSSDSDEEPAVKRRRIQSTGSGDASGTNQSDDGDVVVVDPIRTRARQSMGNADLGDDDLVITGAVGTVVTRDLPHPRPDCAEHRFSASTAVSNAAFCSQCYCFVCDVKASQCRYWGTGARERDHANARPLGYWRRLREAARGGNSNWVHSEYHGSGPLGSGIPSKPAMHQTRLPFPSAGRQSTGSASMAAGAIDGQQGVAAAGGTAASHRMQPAARGVCPAALPGLAASNAHALASSSAADAAKAPQQALQAAPATAVATEAVAPKSAGLGVSPCLSSEVCKLQPLPDPSSDRQAFELGVLRFAVKAVRGLTIAALAARLQRFGFYYSVSTKPEDYGNKLALDNLFDSRFGLHGGKYKSKAVYLKMLPLAPPPEEALAVPTDRVRKVLVIDCLGRTRATVMGVRVHAKAKRTDLLVALAPMLRPLFSASCELLHLVHFSNFESNSARVVEADAVLDDSFFSNATTSEGVPLLVVYRTSHHPAPTWPVASEGPSHSRAPPSTGPTPAWTEMPVYAHSSSPGVPSSVGSPPAWVLAQIRQYKPPPDPSMPPADRYGLTTTRLAVPLLLPLRKDHVRGGREAERDFNAALQRGLEAYRTPAPLSTAHAAPAIVLRGNRSSLTDRPASSAPARWGIAGESLGTAQGMSLHQLTAVMAHDLPATTYRLHDMGTPLVDPSASADALRQSEANIAEAKRREESLRRRKELPSACITELITASRRPHSEDRAALAHLGNNGWCKCAFDATLVPSRRPDAVPREGELVIKVYGWSAGALGRAPLFRPWDDWPSIGKRDDVRFPLPRTLELLATGATDPGDQALLATEAHTTDGRSGPSTSRGPAPAPRSVAALTPGLQSRIQAERRRARSMVASTTELCSTSAANRCRSIDSLVAFMQSGERPTVQQPQGLTVTMRPYQLQSLAFMLELEHYVDIPSGAGVEGGAGPSTSAGSGAGPVSVDPADAPDGGCPGGYRRLFWLPVTNTRGQRFWYSPVFERLTMEVPAQPIGGFLAEEMGLGKTVVSVALTLANPAPPSVVPGAQLPCGRLASRATLVVCAVSLVGQWQAEAVNKTGGSCRIHPYHGPSRIRDPKRLATEFDIVVTTYQTLQSDHAVGTKDPCQQIKWHRVIFDEGHTLRSASAKLYKTAVELAADRKWLCTGTPINNAVDDLLGQFGAIHLMPLGKKTYFDSYIKNTFLTAIHRWGLSSMPLLYVLRHTMIRHTKAQNLGGEGVLQLPEKTEMDVPVYLSAKEQELYRKVHREAQRGWQKLKAVGVAYVNSHLFTATSMLMPLRRICSGGLMRPQDLVVPDPERLSAVAGANGSGGGAGNAAVGSDAFTDSSEVPVPEDISECPICVDTLEQPVVTRCNHWFCRECLTGWLNSSAHHNCPACRQPVAVASLRRGLVGQPPAAAQTEIDDDLDGEPCDGIPCESKLQMLLAELRAMRAADPEAKALVFTQFGQTLEWLKPRLLAEGFGHRTITGDMTQKKRTEAIESFQRDPSTCVFLLSVRSGAVGINLTAANHVFLLEPCMNPAMEEQAVGRSWRMGQQRPVMVKRFFVKGSVEERIMEVVKMRRTAGVCGDSTATGAGPSSVVSAPLTGRAGGRNAGAITAGAMRQDKTDLRINELEMMFRDPEFTQPPTDGTAAGSS